MRALVTGGGGFLGGAIVRRLRAEDWQVASVSRGHYSELDELGVEQTAGDIADAGVVERAAAGCDVVFHVAAKAGFWGPRLEYERANVIGTTNVIVACRRLRIPKLVYTSTPAVVHDGGDIEGGDESLPYARRFLAHYPRTKAAAERMVLSATSPELATVALRPHLIWGPGDNHLLPGIIARGRDGSLRLVGSGTNLVDTTVVDNAAAAHLAACARLAPGAACCGRAYFISNGEPRPLAELVNAFLAAADLPPVRRTVPPRLAYAIGATLEAVYGTLRLRGEPVMTRFLARHLATAHWYDISAARRDLGYEPRVSIDEGLKRLARSFAQ